MDKNKKTIVEEALLDAKRIQEAIQSNTKEILRSVAREEIDGLVKESLNEADFEEEDAESEDVNTDEISNEEPIVTDEPVASDSEETDLVPAVADETPAPTDTPTELGSELEMGTEEVPSLGNELDMTNASDDEVLQVYKKLTGEDEVEIVGNDVHLTVSEPGKYIIKGAAETANATEEPMNTELPVTDELGTEDEAEYEISLDGEDNSGIESELTPVEDEGEISATEEPSAEENSEENEEEEVEELDETIVKSTAQSGKAYSDLTDIKGAGARKAVDEAKKSNESKLLKETTEKYNSLLKENGEFRTALKKFKSMLVETVLFNTNLTYVTKLFTEHATTANEKNLIIKRFDEEVSNLLESKKLYKTIKNELSAKKPVTESIENKISKDIQSSSSKQLNESTVYVDESQKRIKDLINRVEKK